ncbi:unnamed protein product [Pedinophyceae sp. YPF-701]|nr:unnamed protein product [Pedinophyceae sp. YPF-701]
MVFQSLVAMVRGGGRRVPTTGYRVLNSKRGGRSLVKGRGTRPTGYVDKWANFRSLERKQPDIIVPDLAGFPLKPYVAYAVDRTELTEAGVPKESIFDKLKKKLT